VSVTTRGQGAILTRPFWVDTPGFFVNAKVSRKGWLRAEITDVEAKPIPGFEMSSSFPVKGDSCSHELAWQGSPDPSCLAEREIRVRLEARGTKLYSISAGSSEEVQRYWDFELPSCRPMEWFQR